MFYLRVRDDFSAAHYLRGYKGKCESLHGHNWKVELEAVFDRLDEVGLAIDYKDLKRILRDVIAKFDHTELNRLDYFLVKNPTTENIAQIIYTEAKNRLADYGAKRVAVTIWESEDSCCKYEEDA
ncbi:MAG: 6-carboxytetrahydropterin synthase QueD [Deltaproteobacteria bacterium]|nr:6-carboxytetrahydropterin synthase QueD [Deltaproteobacteria bacterium]